MQYRPFGSTGMIVSEIGMGCNRLGESRESEAHWVSLVRQAVDFGVNLFDTSESYQWGGSEDILGLAIGNRADLYVATKVSRVRETNERDFSADRIIERAELSLKRLRRDCIDIYQLHSPSLVTLQEYDWPEAMRRLKEQGKIRISAVSINDAASARWLIDNRLVGAIQVPYNMIEHEFGDEALPMAASAGIGTMVRMPMAQGILTGKFAPGEKVEEGHRALMAGSRMDTLIHRAAGLRPLSEELGISLGILALRYAISPKGVSAAIPGARTIQQLEQNCAASDGVGLGEDVLDRIRMVQMGWNE